VSRVFIGRDQELQQLEQYWAEALNGRGKTVLISGERGMGKRTLALEFGRFAQDVTPEILCASYECTRNCSSYAPFTDLVAQVLESDRFNYLPFVMDLGLAVGKAIPGVRDLVAAGEGVRKAFQDHGRTDNTAGDVFYQFWLFIDRISNGKPLLFTVSNAHYLDSETIALLGYLATRIDKSRVMFVATYDSTETSEQSPIADLISDLLPAKRLERLQLKPFSLPDVGASLQARYGLDDVDDTILTQLHRHTAGNPFFLQELLDYLEDQAPEQIRQNGSFLDGGVPLAGVPDTIGTLLEARISHLDTKLVRTLQLAAIEGPSFSAHALVHLMEDVSEDEIYRHLEILQRQHSLIELEDEAPHSLERYRFTCDLLRHYLSEGGCRLSEHEQRRVHQKIAECYQQLYESGLFKDHLIVAENYEEAGCDQEAARWYMTASVADAKELHLARAAESADRALSLQRQVPNPDEPMYVELLVQSANVDLLLSKTDRASKKMSEALQLASNSGDTRGRSLALEIRGRLGFEAGRYKSAATSFRDAREGFESVADTAGVCRTLGREGACHEKAGRLDEAIGCYRHELTAARLWGDTLASVRATKHLASASYEVGDYEEALSLADKACRLLDEQTDAPDVLESARVRLLLGTILMARHRYQEAEAYLRTAADAFRSIQYRRALTRSLTGLGLSLLWQNRLVESEQVLIDALDQAGDGSPVERSSLLDLLGQVLMRQKRFKDAESSLRESLTIDTEVGLQLSEAESYFQLGSLFVLQNAQDQALDFYQKALSIWSELDDEVELAHVSARIGSVFRKKGDLESAEEWYRKSLRISRRLGDELGEARAHRGLGKIALLNGEGDLAVDFLSRSLPVIRAQMGPVETAGVLSALGQGYEAQDKNAAAQTVCKEALSLLNEDYDGAEIQTLSASLAALGPTPTDA